MNSHYHPYTEISSPHPPSPDNNNYPSLGVVHHNGHGPPTMNPIEQQGFHGIGNAPIKICAGCGGKIADRYFLHALDRYWHNSCLKCSCCGTMLAEISTSCYAKGGMILCKTDYSRIYGCSGACSSCGLMIPASELVMRTSPQVGGNQPSNNQGPIQHHVFHLKCFSCSKCGASLRQGDRYYMLAGSLVCEQDWHKLIKSSTGNSGTPPVRKGKVGRPRRSRD